MLRPNEIAQATKARTQAAQLIENADRALNALLHNPLILQSAQGPNTLSLLAVRDVMAQLRKLDDRLTFDQYDMVGEAEEELRTNVSPTAHPEFFAATYHRGE